MQECEASDRDGDKSDAVNSKQGMGSGRHGRWKYQFGGKIKGIGMQQGDETEQH